MSKTLSVNFFKTECQTGPHTETEFGLCDKRGARAYLDTQNPDDWIATVQNPKGLDVTFTAIDGCVLPNDQGPKKCDVMLTTKLSVHLVELKDQRTPGWFNVAKEQLGSSIELLRETCQLDHFQVFKAHICNKKRPLVHESRREMCNQFHQQFGFHLRDGADVRIDK